MNPRSDSTEPLPIDHPAWRLLWRHARDAVSTQSWEARQELEPFVVNLAAFIDAVCSGPFVVTSFIKTDGAYFDVSARMEGGGTTTFCRVHHTRLGLTLDEIAADVLLADYLGRVAIDVPDAPPPAA